jgi:hypothetical protein
MKSTTLEKKIQASHIAIVFLGSIFGGILASLITYAIFYIARGEENILFPACVFIASSGTYFFTLLSLDALIYSTMKYLKAVKEGKSLAEE